ncbi:MAG: DUF5688 family protein [Roseburia sp.]
MLQELSLEEFKQYMETEGNLFLPYKYRKAGAQIILEEGNGVGRVRLVQEKIPAERMPYLELEQMYEVCGHQFGGMRVASVINTYLECCEQALKADKEETKMMKGLFEEYPEDKIFFRLYPYEENNDFQKYFPGRIRGSTVVLYSVLISQDSEMCRCCTVNAEMLVHWGKTEKELHAAAERNTPRLFPYQLHKKILVTGKAVYFITSAQFCFGLGTLLGKDGPLKEISEETEADVSVFPLSVHEALAVPCTEGEWMEKVCFQYIKEMSPFHGTEWYYNKELDQIALDEKERIGMQEILCGQVMDAAERRMR